MCFVERRTESEWVSVLHYYCACSLAERQARCVREGLGWHGRGQEDRECQVQRREAESGCRYCAVWRDVRCWCCRGLMGPWLLLYQWVLARGGRSQQMKVARGWMILVTGTFREGVKNREKEARTERRRTGEAMKGPRVRPPRARDACLVQSTHTTSSGILRRCPGVA